MRALDRLLTLGLWLGQLLVLGLVAVIRRSLDWSCAQPRQAFVLIFVLAIHVSWVVHAQRQPQEPLSSKSSGRVHVNTVELIRPKPPKPVVRPKKVAKAPAKAPVKPKEPKKKPKPTPEKVAKPPEKKKAPTPVAKAPVKPQPKVVKKETPKSQEKKKEVVDTEATYLRQRAKLLKQIEEQMDLIEKHSTSYEEEEELVEEPKEAESVHSQLPQAGLFELAQTDSYNEELVKRLQLLLKLPAYGDVRIKLTLRSDGSVQAVEVLSSESSQNQAYVEQVLPSLKLVGFGSNFAGQQTRSFILTLTNDV